MKTAVIYARVSSSNDRQDTSRQIEDLKKYAISQDIEIVNIFQEHISGAKRIEERQILGECLEYCKRESVNILLLSELSRLGRSTLQVLRSLDILHESKVSVYIQNLGLYTLQPNGEVNPIASIMVTVLAEMANIERSNIQYRLNSGRANYIAKGGKQGKANIRNLHPAAEAARAYMHRAGLELLRQARVEFCGEALTLQVRGQGAPGPLRTCQQADGVLFLRQGAQLLRQLGHGAAPYPQGLQPEVRQMPHRGVKAAPRHGVQIQRFLFCINFRQRVKIDSIPVQPLAQAALLHQPLHILLQQPVGVIALLFHFCRVAHRQQTVAIIKQSV